MAKRIMKKAMAPTCAGPSIRKHKPAASSAKARRGKEIKRRGLLPHLSINPCAGQVNLYDF